MRKLSSALVVVVARTVVAATANIGQIAGQGEGFLAQVTLRGSAGRVGVGKEREREKSCTGGNT